MAQQLKVEMTATTAQFFTSAGLRYLSQALTPLVQTRIYKRAPFMSSHANKGSIHASLESTTSLLINLSDPFPVSTGRRG